jgi:hypothetical protein
MTAMTAIPMALPLASSQPGPIHTFDGRAWYGHGDRINPDTQMFEGAQFTLARSPRQGDDLWIDGNALTIPLTQPLPAPQPTDWPTLMADLDREIAEARAALASTPRFHAAAAKAVAGTACWRAQRAVQEARIAVAEAEAAAEREQQEEAQRGETWDWLVAMDAASNHPDLSELDHNDHPSLSPAQRSNLK